MARFLLPLLHPIQFAIKLDDDEWCDFIIFFIYSFPLRLFDKWSTCRECCVVGVGAVCVHQLPFSLSFFHDVTWRVSCCIGLLTSLLLPSSPPIRRHWRHCGSGDDDGHGLSSLYNNFSCTVRGCDDECDQWLCACNSQLIIYSTFFIYLLIIYSRLLVHRIHARHFIPLSLPPPPVIFLLCKIKDEMVIMFYTVSQFGINCFISSRHSKKQKHKKINAVCGNCWLSNHRATASAAHLNRRKTRTAIYFQVSVCDVLLSREGGGKKKKKKKWVNNGPLECAPRSNIDWGARTLTCDNDDE